MSKSTVTKLVTSHELQNGNGYPAPMTTATGRIANESDRRLRKGCLWWVGRIALGVVALFLVAAIAGAAYQAKASSRDRSLFAPPGELVDIGDYRLHLHCLGSGGPTVVLESGAGGIWLDWDLVQDSIAQVTKACSYDRAGFGWSDGANQPQAPERVASDLRVLLERAGVETPYVLVGHSVGGIYVRSFANQFTLDVVGMVLVESSHENQGTRMPAEMAEVDAGLMRLLGICRAVAPFGIMRLLNVAESFTSGLPFPDEKKQAYVATMNRTGYCRSLTDEYAAADDATRQPGRPTTLGDLPLAVITAGPRQPTDGAVAEVSEVQARADSTWRVLQAELFGLSTNAVHVIADESGHYVQFDQPEVVIDAIRQIVTSIRGSGPAVLDREAVYRPR